MKKWCFVLIISFSLMIPSHGIAQEIPTFDTLEIDLWPEYDQPEMLVIYRAELSNDVSPPVEIKFRIPVEAGEPHAVAVRNSNGSLLTAPYERSVAGEWAIITLIATMPGIQLEYYDPQIQKIDTHRTFQYVWPGDYLVESLSVQLQQPFDASQVKVIPTQTRIVSGSDGLSYHIIELGGQPAGVSMIVRIEYNKSSDKLTVERLPVQPVSPITSSISGHMNMDKIPLVLVIFGLSLLTGGIYWYWKLGKQQVNPKVKAHQKHPASVPRNLKTNDDETIYCLQCGKRAVDGDRFCRSCGTKLRRN